VAIRDPGQDGGPTSPGAPRPPSSRLPCQGPSVEIRFFAAHRRQRRAAGFYAGLVILALVASGLPLGIAVAPLLYVASMPIAMVMSLFYPKTGWDAMRYGVPIMIPLLIAMAFSHSDYRVHESATGLVEVHGEFLTGAHAPEQGSASLEPKDSADAAEVAQGDRW